MWTLFEPVHAVTYFAPEARAVPAVWELIAPAGALRARLAGAASALCPLLKGLDAEVTRAADLLGRAAGELDCAGRVQAAANAALPPPEDEIGRLWQAATVLREHRGDGHFAAMATADVDGCEVLVLRCGLDMRREDLQPIATDRAAARPWARLGPGAVADLARVLTPIARACAQVVPYPSPIGVPAPGTAGPPA